MIWAGLGLSITALKRIRLVPLNLRDGLHFASLGYAGVALLMRVAVARRRRRSDCFEAALDLFPKAGEPWAVRLVVERILHGIS